MHTITLHLSPAQADVIQRLVVSSPWFRNQAKKCIFTSGERSTLEVELHTDCDHLLDMLAVADRFGYPYRTCRALEQRLRTAVEHGKAIRRSREAA